VSEARLPSEPVEDVFRISGRSTMASKCSRGTVASKSVRATRPASSGLVLRGHGRVASRA